MTQLYAIRSMLKTGTTEQSASASDWNEHLSQNWPRVKLLGRLYDKDQHVVGLLGIIEASDLEQAQHFLRTSPLLKAYELVAINRIEFEVGHL